MCNRTFYGRVDHTYHLEVPPPPTARSGPPALLAAQRPLLCTLTFHARGHAHGDIAQVTFDHFHVGHFNDSAAEGKEASV